MTENSKEILDFIKPVLGAALSKVLSPQLEKFSDWLKITSPTEKVEEFLFNEKFLDYLNRTYLKVYYLNTLVFPTRKILLKEIYYPLTIKSGIDSSLLVVDEKNISNFINSKKRILISDSAGMGKSTLMRWITLNLIDNLSTFPILIELRKLNSTNSLLNEITNLINPLDASLESLFILQLLKQGFFTIIFDGYDEIPLHVKESITIEIKDLINKASQNNYILTSRPDSSLSSFGEFEIFNIKPLELGESVDIIRKYDTFNEIKFADKLIAEIYSSIKLVRDLLKNPFLVSLLYKTYTYSQDVPSKKSNFYDEVYSSLFKYHDSSKDGFRRPKLSNLDIREFEFILCHIAFETAKHNIVIYSESELLKYIANAKSKSINVQFKEIDFLEDLLSNVPLFIKDGNQIKWAHKSFQDYFAAKYIFFHPKKEDIMNRIYSGRKTQYLNILDIVYELDLKVFRKTILYPLLIAFKYHYENSYNSFVNISDSDLDERRSSTFGRDVLLLVYSDKVRGLVASKLLLDFQIQNSIACTSSIAHSQFCGSSKHTFELLLLYLLVDKIDFLFKDRVRKYNYMTDFMITTGKVFFINDNPNEEFNKDGNFIKINEFLNSFGVGKVLDYNKCISEIEKIEDEIGLEKSNEELSDI